MELEENLPIFIWGLATSHSTVLLLSRMLGTAAFNTPCSRNRARPLWTAALASFWYWDMHILIWYFAGRILRQKTLVFRNNAEQNKLTALNNNSKNSLKTYALARFFLAQNAKNVRMFCVCVGHLPLSYCKLLNNGKEHFTAFFDKS